MKKASASPPAEPEENDLLPEYRFDYQQAKPNRFASETARKRLTVALDEEVAAVFTTPESVNRALRALIEVVPPTQGAKKG